tara:strand:+ start:123 stop:272 length:150 start_codon:yes stop_codon:yes gene_type:complete
MIGNPKRVKDRKKNNLDLLLLILLLGNMKIKSITVNKRQRLDVPVAIKG